jgi:hypothetical protein
MGGESGTGGEAAKSQGEGSVTVRQAISFMELQDATPTTASTK